MTIGRKISLLSIFVLTTLASACSGGANTNGTAQDAVKIRLMTEPGSPRVGNGKLNIDVADATGKPIDNLKIDVSMDMTSMSMATQVGLAQAQGQGRYIFSVTFHSRGQYKVHLWVRRNGELLKNEEFEIQVAD